MCRNKILIEGGLHQRSHNIPLNINLNLHAHAQCLNMYDADMGILSCY